MAGVTVHSVYSIIWLRPVQTHTTSAHLASVNKLLNLRIWKKHDLPGKTQAVTMVSQFQENIKAAILGG